jgi:hypothetical protein
MAQRDERERSLERVNRTSELASPSPGRGARRPRFVSTLSPGWASTLLHRSAEAREMRLAHSRERTGHMDSKNQGTRGRRWVLISAVVALVALAAPMQAAAGAWGV